MVSLKYDETERFISETARSFFTQEVPPRKLHTFEASDTGYDPALWQQMAQLGWMALPFDEALGGGGATTTQLGVLLEEFGRTALASPFFQTVAAAGEVLRRLGDTPRATDLMRAIAEGGTRAALIASPNPAETASATDTGGGKLSLNGGPFVIEWAHVADALVVPATSSGNGASGNVELLAIDPQRAGVTIEPVTSMDNERIARVTLQNVVAEDGDRLRARPATTSDLADALAAVGALRAAEMTGAMRRVLEMTVEYVNVRHQFGRPLGSFQAVQHGCANMKIDADGAWLATYEALSRASAGLPFRRHALIASYFAGQAAERVTTTAAQLHGGMGFMREYHLQFYFRRAKAQQLRLGDLRYQLRAVADEVFGPVAAPAPKRTAAAVA